MQETPEEECKFIVNDHKNNYQSYCSAIYAGKKSNPKPNHKRMWCIGIDASGKLRPRVKPNKDKAHFLARPISTPMIPHTDLVPLVTTTTEPVSSGNRENNRGRGKNRNKNRKNKDRRKKKEKCEEDTLFSRKCADKNFGYRNNRRRNHRGHRRQIPNQRPFQFNKPNSNFFSALGLGSS